MMPDVFQPKLGGLVRIPERSAVAEEAAEQLLAALTSFLAPYQDAPAR